jgi:hypothetical protein
MQKSWLGDQPMKFKASGEAAGSRSVWGCKSPAEHGCGSKQPALGVKKWLERPRDERIITKTTGKAQFESSR